MSSTNLPDLLTGILVLIVGGLLGGVGTYLVKPPLDAWLERRKQARQARETARRQAEEAAQQLQLAGQHVLDYRDKLVRELRGLRILDMVRPMDLERTYVRVRVQEAQPMRYADADAMAAQARGDPNLLFELSQDKLAQDTAQSLLPEDALRRYRHMVVLGDPGAGKTTMLKYLCLLAAQARLSGFPDFPVFVSLGRYAKAAHASLLDFVVADLAERYGFPPLVAHLEQRLESGAVLLLLDGLDEVTVGGPEEAEAAYRRASEAINHLATRYPQCPIVVTSRRAGWKGLLAPSFVAMSVLDFTWEDIQRFVDNWFGQGSDRARRLQAVLSHQARMQALAANPLLLSLIAIVFERDLELPERRAKLYERCVQVLLTEWDAHRGIKRAGHFTTDRKRDLLEDIALHYHRQGLRYFPQHDLLVVIAAYLPTVDIPAGQAGLVLDEIAAQHGLLKEQAAEWYGFLHLTLQEYFTAVALDKGGQWELALAQRHDPWWEEVILLLAGMLKDAAPLLDAILSEADDIFFANLLLAGRCLAGTPRIGRLELREQVCVALRRLIEDQARHWLPRAQALETLGEAEGERGARYLVHRLADEALDWRVRAAAADALAAAGRTAVVPDLLALLPDERINRNVRERIADSLIELCDASAIAPLLRLVSDQNIDSQVRGRLVRSVALLGQHSVIPDLIQLLSDPSLDDYRAWYVGRSLAYAGFPAQPHDLLRLLRDTDVRLVSRWALAKAVDNLDRSAGPQVVAWLTDASIETSNRWSVAYRLGRFGDPVRAGLRALYADQSLDLSLRAAIGIALLNLGETERAPELGRFLLSPDINYYVRKKIAEALAVLGGPGIAPLLVTVLEEQDLRESVRITAADSLAGLGDSTVAPQLLDFIARADVEPRIRARAADALASLDLHGLLPRVLALVADERVDALVRGRAVHGLVQAGEGVTWLIQLLDRPDIGEEAYLALHRASRRAGLRVLRTDAGYRVLPLHTS